MEGQMRIGVVILSLLLAISILINLIQSAKINQLENTITSQRKQLSEVKEQPKVNNQVSPKRNGSPSSSADAGLVKGLGRSVLIEELGRWQAIGLVSNFEFDGSRAIVYLNHSDWLALPYSTQADFKAGIRMKWPDGSVSYRDSQTGESL
jgi:hypothetical protein